MKKYLILIFLLFASPAWTTTYYVSNCGTVGNDSNNGTATETPWLTINKVNISSFNAGDSILFNRGCQWYEQLTVPSSGSAGLPIIFGAYGTGALPIINGANLLSSGWTDNGSNVWKATVTTDPEQVFFNEVRGVKVASVLLVNSASKWYWASNVLYVYSTSDPATAFTSPGIEASVRNLNISITGINYITIENLNLQKCKAYGIGLNGTSSHITIDGCTVGRPFVQGITSQGSSHIDFVTVKNCLVNWAGGSGIAWDDPCHDWTIEDNIVHNNSQYYDGTDTFKWTGGIKSFAGMSLENIIVQRNTVYNNGVLPDASSNGGGGQGIWLDTYLNTTYTGGPVITRNKVYGNISYGIHMECTSYTTVTYNLSYSNGATGSDGGIGISSDSWDCGSPASYNRIYNNVAYGNSFTGIRVMGANAGTAAFCIGNEIKNNITVGNGGTPFYPLQLAMKRGGENDGTMGSGNVYTNNALGTAATGFIEWGMDTYKATYAAWYSVYAAANGNTIETDPLFVSTVTPDFRLQSTSPCKDAGVNVGLTQDYVGTAVPQGAGYDIGAYEFNVYPTLGPGITVKGGTVR